MNVGRDQGDFTGMIGACERTPNMTLLKILAILLVAGGLGFLALPGFAASDHDGVTGPFAKPSNSGALREGGRTPAEVFSLLPKD